MRTFFWFCLIKSSWGFFCYNVRKLSLLRAHREQIEHSWIPHRHKNETLLLFWYLQYSKKHTGNKHKTVLGIPPFVLHVARKLSWLKTHQKQIDHSSIPRRKICIYMRHSSSSHIVNMQTKQKWCYAFRPSSLMMWGSSADSNFTENIFKDNV